MTDDKPESDQLFSHIRTAHKDAAKPSDHYKPTAKPGWMANLAEMDAGQSKDLLADEMLQSLSIITPRERDLIAVEGVIGTAINDHVSIDLIERRLRLSIAVKGKGRNDILAMVGALKQSISIPTSIVKRVKNLRSGGDSSEAPTTPAETE